MGLSRTATCFIISLACSTAIQAALGPTQPRLWSGSFRSTNGQHFLFASDNSKYQLVFPAGKAPMSNLGTGSRVTLLGQLAPGANSSIIVTAEPQEIKDLEAVPSNHAVHYGQQAALQARRSLVARRRLQPIQEVSGSFTSITMRINVCGEEPPYSHQEVSRTILGSQDLSLKSFFEQCSFNKLSVSTSSDKNLVVEQVIPVRGSACSGFTCSSLDDLNKVAQEAEDYCQNTLNIDMTKYSVKILLLPESFTGCNAGIRLGYIGCFQAVPGPDTPGWRCRSWISGSDLRSIAHEVLHNVGLGHAGKNGNDYGDGLCPMGASAGMYCPNAYHAAKLGWSRSTATLDLDQVGSNEWFVRSIPARAKQSDSFLLLSGRSPEDDLYVSFQAPARFEAQAGSDDSFKVLVHQERKENNQKSWLIGTLEPSDRFTSRGASGAEWVIRYDSYSEASMEATVRVCKSTASGHCSDQGTTVSSTPVTRQAVSQPNPDPPSPPPPAPRRPAAPGAPARPGAPKEPSKPSRPPPTPPSPSPPSPPPPSPSPPSPPPPSPPPPRTPPPSPPGTPSPPPPRTPPPSPPETPSPPSPGTPPPSPPDTPPPPSPEPSSSIVMSRVQSEGQAATTDPSPPSPPEPDFPPFPSAPPPPIPPEDASQTQTQTQTRISSQPVFITTSVRRTTMCTTRAKCGDGICDAWAGENCETCKADCLRVQLKDGHEWCCGGPTKVTTTSSRGSGNSGSDNSGSGNSGSGNSGSGNSENSGSGSSQDDNSTQDVVGDGCLVGGQSGMCSSQERFCRPMCPPPTFWILKWLKRAYRTDN